MVNFIHICSDEYMIKVNENDLGYIRGNIFESSYYTYEVDDLEAIVNFVRNRDPLFTRFYQEPVSFMKCVYFYKVILFNSPVGIIRHVPPFYLYLHSKRQYNIENLCKILNFMKNVFPAKIDFHWNRIGF